MARLTPEQHEDYMRIIMERFDNPDDANEMVTALRDDFNESMQVIEGGVTQTMYDELKGQHDAIRKAYIDRFFGGNEDLVDVKKDQTEDIEDDAKVLTYEELLKDPESYTGKDDN